MLNVDRGHDVYAVVEQLEHVLVPLLVPAARDIAMGQLVDDGDLGIARDDGVEVHLLQDDAAIFNLPLRDDLEVRQLRLGVLPPVGLDQRDNDVETLRAQLVGVANHAVRLADTGCGADVHAKPRAAFFLDLGEQIVGRRLPVHIHALILRAGKPLPHRRLRTSYAFLTPPSRRAALLSVMASSNQSSFGLNTGRDDRFAEVDRVVRFWWVTIFLALVITASLIRG